MMQNDRQSPYYGSSSPPTEQSVDADMSVVKIHLLKGSLVKLMSMGLSIMAEIKCVTMFLFYSLQTLFTCCVTVPVDIGLITNLLIVWPCQQRTD